MRRPEGIHSVDHASPRDESTRVSAGTYQVASAADQTDQGAAALASGAGELSDGSGQVASGTSDLATSTGTLATGLTDAAGAMPNYADVAARSSLASAVAAPVQVTSSVTNPVTTSRPAAASLALGLALWLGATALTFLRPVVPGWAVAAQAGPLRTALLGLAPLAVLATVEAVAFAGLAPLTGVDAASSAGLAGFVLVGALAIGALQQAILALAPRRGQVLVLLVGVLQLASLAAPLPPQTAPTVIQWLAEVLPLPALTGGLNQAIVGGAVTSVGTTVALLLAWTIAGVAVTAVAVRRRVALTSPSLVHPALQAA